MAVYWCQGNNKSLYFYKILEQQKYLTNRNIYLLRKLSDEPQFSPTTPQYCLEWVVMVTASS